MQGKAARNTYIVKFNKHDLKQVSPGEALAQHVEDWRIAPDEGV